MAIYGGRYCTSDRSYCQDEMQKPQTVWQIVQVCWHRKRQHNVSGYGCWTYLEMQSSSEMHVWLATKSNVWTLDRKAWHGLQDNTASCYMFARKRHGGSHFGQLPLCKAALVQLLSTPLHVNVELPDLVACKSGGINSEYVLSNT
jgi:hypothetical protein